MSMLKRREYMQKIRKEKQFRVFLNVYIWVKKAKGFNSKTNKLNLKVNKKFMFLRLGK